ncbi:MAG: YcnI family protein [Actinomycetota bacterium]|nr:YcnI family protein [Actinomycetota bacterium]
MVQRVVVVAAVVGMLATAAPALAHVTVNPREAPQGGFAKLAFRVPNERDNASTTQLEVAFPSEPPIPNVRVKPHPGWTYLIDRRPLPTPIPAEGGPITHAVTKITWTATGPPTAIKPDEFDEFEVSLRLPQEADQLVFPAIQTYSSGERVGWIELPVAGAEEPEHPAPVLRLIPQQPEQTAAGDEDVATAAEVASANRLAWIALIAGLLGLVVAIGAIVALFARRRAFRQR